MDLSAAPGTRIDAPSAEGRARLPLIDAVRGVAFLAMAIYHFAWDLGYFGYFATDVTVDLGWRIFARSIAGTFLALVGVSLVLASRNGFRRGRFLRRLGILAAAAAAITGVTWFVFPDMFIFFGILHAIAVSSVLGLAFVRAPIPLVIVAAALCFLAPWFFSAPVFDAPALWWLGLYTEAPRSVDYVPIFPWFGVVLAGIAAARTFPRLFSGQLGRPGMVKARMLAPLAWAGRHSLPLYLLHQPVLFGLVYLAAQIVPPSLVGFEASYIESCTASCVGSELDADLCRRTCGCLVEQTKSEDLWSGLVGNTLTGDQITRYYELADQCRAAGGAE